MSVDEDKYPTGSGRRRFVKGVVAGAALSAVGASTAVSVQSLTTSSGVGGGATEAVAIENTDGPAPRGMPQIPVEIDNEGFIRGVWPDVKEIEQGGVTVTVARTELGGRTYSSEWFQYCGVETYQGVRPEYEPEGGNYFHVGSEPAYDWQSGMSEGDRLSLSAFDDYTEWGNGVGVAGLGKPATATWRSQGADDVLPVQIVRSPVIEELVASGSATGADGERYEVSDGIRTWLEAATADGVIAWLNKCTHFCCVPGFKQLDSAAKFDASDEVYCPCHQSVYEPFSPVSTLFTARPRPTD